MNNIPVTKAESRAGRPIALAMLALFGVAIMLAVTSCSRPEADNVVPGVDYYTCTMHPSVRSHDPDGKCPICGMNLVPVMRKAGHSQNSGAKTSGQDHSKMLAEPAVVKSATDDTNESTPSEFIVPVKRQQQIGVTYATVSKVPLDQAIRTVGNVTYDKQRHWNYVARVDGYVQKLAVSSRGDLVESNQALLTIYSPDLLTAQQELVNLLRMRDEAKKTGSQPAMESAERLIVSSKRRLSLWNISGSQIAELERTRVPSDTLTLYSPFKGVVQDLPVDQGRRVAMGDQLVDIADLSTVWVWAEFYQDELPLLRKGMRLTITSSSYPGEKFNGKISIIDPFINDATRTVRVRLEVENASLKLRPEMYVDVELDTHPGKGLVVPASAVMPTGKRNIVFVDQGGGKLEPRFIGLGKKFGTNYVVNSGLSEGDRVVNSANFLIDAEAKVQGALKSW